MPPLNKRNRIAGKRSRWAPFLLPDERTNVSRETRALVRASPALSCGSSAAECSRGGSSGETSAGAGSGGPSSYGVSEQMFHVKHPGLLPCPVAGVRKMGGRCPGATVVPCVETASARGFPHCVGASVPCAGASAAWYAPFGADGNAERVLPASYYDLNVISYSYQQWLREREHHVRREDCPCE